MYGKLLNHLSSVLSCPDFFFTTTLLSTKAVILLIHIESSHKEHRNAHIYLCFFSTFRFFFFLSS